MRSIKRILSICIAIFLVLSQASMISYAQSEKNNADEKEIESGQTEQQPFMTQGKIVMKKGTKEQISWINLKEETQVTYLVEDSSIINVSTGGAVTSFEVEGVSKVTAYLQQDGISYEETVTVQVEGETDTGLQMSPSKVQLEKGDLFQISPKCIPEDAKDVITYAVSGAAIVTVDEHGIIMAKEYGETQVIASLANGAQVVCNVKVGTLIEQLSLRYLEKNTITLGVGQSRTIYTKIEPQSASVKKLEWTSENPSIARVDEQGKIIGKKQGTAKIRVSTMDGSGLKKTITVKVKKRSTGTKYSQKNLTIVSVNHQKYTYREMVEDLKALKKKYPEHIFYEKIGESHDNRGIYQVTFGNPNASKVVFIQAAIHGREYMTTQLVMKQLEFYCANYYSGVYEGSYFSKLFDNVRFEIIPMANPDGVTISQDGANGIRNNQLRQKLKKMCKTYGKGRSSYYRAWKANARGVDLNRNFNLNWYKIKSSVKSPCAYYYKGKRPVSEKETKVLVDATNAADPDAVLSYHAMGEILYWNFGQKGKEKKKELELLGVVRKISGYKPVWGSYADEISSGYGDWVAIHKKVPTVSIEIGNTWCPLPKSQFPRAWNKNHLMLAGVAKLYQ